MSLLRIAVCVTTFWCGLSLVESSACAQKDEQGGCQASDDNTQQTSGIGMVQKKRILERHTLEENAEETEMDAALMREMERSVARDRARVKMRVEKDLSKLSANHYRAWDPQQDCHANADAAFRSAPRSFGFGNRDEPSGTRLFQGLLQ